MLAHKRTRLVQIRHEPTIDGDHVRSLRVARRLGQLLNFRQRRSQRLFNHTRQASFEQLDSNLYDLFDRHDGDARVELLIAQHLVEIFVRPNKTKRPAKLDCPVEIEITRRYELDLIRVRRRVSRERCGMAGPRMLATPGNRKANHCASTVADRENSQPTIRCTLISCASRDTSSRATLPGASARQFAEPQAVARRSVSSSLSPRSCATANPANAASPQPTGEQFASGEACETNKSLSNVRCQIIPLAPSEIATLLAPAAKNFCVASAALSALSITPPAKSEASFRFGFTKSGAALSPCRKASPLVSSRVRQP